MRQRVVTRAVPLTPIWAALLARAQPKHYRHGLNRFAAYCSAVGICPGEVSPQTLVSFHDALVAECFVKEPRRILKHTVALWNHCMRNIEGWPQVRLASPFTRLRAESADLVAVTSKPGCCSAAGRLRARSRV